MGPKINALCWLFLVVFVFAGCSLFQVGAVGVKTNPVVNPYAEVDWESYGHYKANLHTHTTQSDGSFEPGNVIDMYHELGYKVLALTDHDTCGPPNCDKKNPNKTETTWPWGKYGRDPGELGMIPIMGNEVGRDHMISYFNDYGNADEYDSVYKWNSDAYTLEPIDDGSKIKATKIAENTLQEIRSRNGLAVMAHPGEYIHPSDWYAQLFLEFDNLVGIEVFNYISRDSWPWGMRLWDELLMGLMPGRSVWGFSNDDMHRTGEAGHAYEVLLLPELSEKAVRESMENGCFYFCWVYEAGKQAPAIKSIRIDKKAGTGGTVTIEAEGAQEIVWISQGRTVAYGASFKIEKSRGAKQYIRAQIRGKDGYTYTQPFSLPLNQR